jgi:hypothetical protein
LGARLPPSPPARMELEEVGAEGTPAQGADAAGGMDAVQVFATSADFLRATVAGGGGGGSGGGTRLPAWCHQAARTGWYSLPDEAAGSSDSDGVVCDSDSSAGRRSGGSGTDEPVRTRTNVVLRRRAHAAARKVLDVCVARVVAATHEGVFHSTCKFFLDAMAARGALAGAVSVAGAGAAGAGSGAGWPNPGVPAPPRQPTWGQPFSSEPLHSVPTAVVFAGAYPAARLRHARGGAIWCGPNAMLLVGRPCAGLPSRGRPALV